MKIFNRWSHGSYEQGSDISHSLDTIHYLVFAINEVELVSQVDVNIVKSLFLESKSQLPGTLLVISGYLLQF